MEGLTKFLSSAPVLIMALLTFTAGILIEFNRFYPDLLFHPLGQRQSQVIKGVTESTVSLFKGNDRRDWGNIKKRKALETTGPKNR